MCRAVLIFAWAAALSFACVAHALAVAEFCPAVIADPHQVKDGGGTLFSTTLTAEGPRTVVADVEAQTENGWYAFSIPATAITQEAVKYATTQMTFTRNEPSSSVLYVRFPSDAGKILRWWVTHALSSGETLMGWDAKGRVTCDPLALSIGAIAPRNPNLLTAFIATRVSPPAPDLDRMPGPGDTVLTAVSTPGKQFACDTPFANSTVMHAVSPVWPVGYSTTVQLETLVRVNVAPDGSLVDAWVWQPSGGQAFDTAALEAARRSTYAAGRAFCVPAPGRYLFRALFNP